MLKEILVCLVVGFVFIVIVELVKSGFELSDIIGLKANQYSTKVGAMVTVMKQ